VFALPEAMDFLYDQVTITTPYLSAVITLLTFFDALYASTSSDDLISVHKGYLSLDPISYISQLMQLFQVRSSTY
jgi:hypothetical protein